MIAGISIRKAVLKCVLPLEQVAQGSACLRARQPDAPSSLPGGKQRNTLSTLDEDDQVGTASRDC